MLCEDYHALSITFNSRFIILFGFLINVNKIVINYGKLNILFTETTLGVQLNAQDDPNSSFLTSMNLVLDIISKRIFHLWLQPDWLFKFFPQYKKHEEYIGVLHNFTDEVNYPNLY